MTNPLVATPEAAREFGVFIATLESQGLIDHARATQILGRAHTVADSNPAIVAASTAGYLAAIKGLSVPSTLLGE